MIADELENLFSAKGYSKLRKKFGGGEESSSSDEQPGPQLPSKYLGKKVKKLSKEEEAERQEKQKQKY